MLVYQYPARSSLYIKLAERLIRVEPGMESYLQRLPFVDDLCFIDEHGNALDFETTTSPDMLRFQTRIGMFRIVFQDATTLVIGLNDHIGSGIRFRTRPIHWFNTKSGGSLRHVRNLSYQTNGKIVSNRTKLDDFGIVTELIVESDRDCSISLKISDDDSDHVVLPFSAVCEASENRWQEWFNSVPDVIEPYRQKYAYAWWVMGNNLVNPLGYLKYQAMMPTKAFYVGAWLWDSALHAIAYRHASPKLAREQIHLMLAYQLSDGMLPDAIFDEGIVSEIDHPFRARVTKPPLLTWAALKIYETEPNIDFLREVYEPLAQCNNWWMKRNDDDADGIVQYNHPYSSGLDDSPLWDHGMPVESPDINTYLQVDMISLAVIAEILGRKNEASRWRRKAKTLTKRMIEHLWDEETGIFRALHNEKPIPVLAPFNLYPLWTGQLPRKITQQLLAHLRDPAEFWGAYILPTIAKNDPAYQPEKMWRGPVWANINYFFVEALQKIGEHELATELRDKTLALISSQTGIYEYYNSNTGKIPDSAAPAFGWTAAVFIELALQASAERKQSSVDHANKVRDAA